MQQLKNRGQDFHITLLSPVRFQPRFCVGSPSGKRRHGKRSRSAREAWANADGAEVAAVAGENAVNPAPLGYGSDRPVNDSEVEILEFGIQLQCLGDVGGSTQPSPSSGTRFRHSISGRTKKIP